MEFDTKTNSGAGQNAAVELTRRDILAGGLAVLAAAAAPGLALGQERRARPAFIDVHHHALIDFWFEAAQSRIAAQQVGGRIGPQWRGWTPEKSLVAMDRNNVAMAVLSITAPGIWFGDLSAAHALTRRCNERMAEIAHAKPDRFGFAAHLSLPDIDGSLAEIDYAYDVLKADGIGLMTNYDGKYLGHASFMPIFAALNQRKAVVVVHPTTADCCLPTMPDVPPSTIEFLHDTDRAILNLMATGCLHRFPDIRFVFSHAGGSMAQMLGRVARTVANTPELSEKVPDGAVAAFQRLYFDVANSANRGAFGALTAYVSTTQIVFGSDHPVAPMEGTLDGLKSLNLSRQDYARIAQQNALRLFPQFASRMRV